MASLIVGHRKVRHPTEDAASCRREVVRLLSSISARMVGPGATAGWFADRTMGFSEFIIGVVLRQLRTEKVVKRTVVGSFAFWRLRTQQDDIDDAEKEITED
jgi:hypothetical protein